MHLEASTLPSAAHLSQLTFLRASMPPFAPRRCHRVTTATNRSPPQAKTRMITNQLEREQLLSSLPPSPPALQHQHLPTTPNQAAAISGSTWIPLHISSIRHSWPNCACHAPQHAAPESKTQQVNSSTESSAQTQPTNHRHSTNAPLSHAITS
jgi:hypothetical protein